MTSTENLRAEDGSPEGVSQKDNPLHADLPRRTILTGAAWAVPVVALAVATPLAAASAPEEFTLIFDEDIYTPSADCNVTGVTLTMTDQSGQPAAGQPVLVTLPSGYTFPGGSSTGTFVTAADGTIALPTITAAPGAGTFTMSATATAVTASDTSEIDIIDEPTVYEYNSATGQTYRLTNVPAGSTALGGGYYQAPNGDIYFWNRSTPIVTGAQRVKTSEGPNGAYVLDYISSTGVASSFNNRTGVTTTYPSVPATATPVGAGFFLGAGGRLYKGNTSIAGGVTSASGYAGVGGGFIFADYVTSPSTGGHTANTTNSNISNYSNVPAGSTTVGGGYFLSPTGDLYYANTRVATGVASAVGYASSGTGSIPGQRYFADIVFTDGRAAFVTNGGTISEMTNIPAGATPLGGGYWQSGDDLYVYKNRGRRIASGVTSAAGYPSSGTNGTSSYWNDYVVAPSTCLV